MPGWLARTDTALKLAPPFHLSGPPARSDRGRPQACRRVCPSTTRPTTRQRRPAHSHAHARPPTPAHATGRTPAGHHTTTHAHSGCPHCPRCPRCQTCRVLKRCNGSGGRVSGRLGAVCVCSVVSANHQFCRVQMTVTPPPTWGISIPAARQLPRRTSPRAPDCPRQGIHTTPTEERESPIPILLFVGLPLTAPITLFSEALAFRLYFRPRSLSWTHRPSAKGRRQDSATPRYGIVGVL